MVLEIVVVGYVVSMIKMGIIMILMFCSIGGSYNDGD